MIFVWKFEAFRELIARVGWIYSRMCPIFLCFKPPNHLRAPWFQKIVTVGILQFSSSFVLYTIQWHAAKIHVYPAFTDIIQTYMTVPLCSPFADGRWIRRLIVDVGWCLGPLVRQLTMRFSGWLSGGLLERWGRALLGSLRKIFWIWLWDLVEALSVEFWKRAAVGLSAARGVWKVWIERMDNERS